MDLQQRQQELQTEISGVLGRLLKDTFGKGPDGIAVAIGGSYISVYLRNFQSPIERFLLERQETEALRFLRNHLMQSLLPDLKACIRISAGLRIEEMYYDWNMMNRSAIFIGSMEPGADQGFPADYEYARKEALHREIIKLSESVQKTPETIESCLINGRTLLVYRSGVLVEIEKQLLVLGYEEPLRTAKRRLEGGLLQNNLQLPAILQRKVTDCFVDWDFERDKSVIALLLAPSDQSANVSSD